MKLTRAIAATFLATGLTLGLTACDQGTPSAPGPVGSTPSGEPDEFEASVPPSGADEDEIEAGTAAPDETVFDDSAAKDAIRSVCERLSPEDLTQDLRAPATFVREYGVDDGYAYCSYSNPTNLPVKILKGWPGMLRISLEGPASEVSPEDSVVTLPGGGFGTYITSAQTYSQIDLVVVPSGSGYAYRISPELRYEYDASYTSDGGMTYEDEERHRELAAHVAMSIFAE